MAKGDTTTSTTAALAGLTGRVVTPDDGSYPAASAGYNLLLFRHRPAVIVFAQNTDDVVHGLDVALHLRDVAGWTCWPSG